MPRVSAEASPRVTPEDLQTQSWARIPHHQLNGLLKLFYVNPAPAIEAKSSRLASSQRPTITRTGMTTLRTRATHHARGTKEEQSSPTKEPIQNSGKIIILDKLGNPRSSFWALGHQLSTDFLCLCVSLSVHTLLLTVLQ